MITVSVDLQSVGWSNEGLLTRETIDRLCLVEIVSSNRTLSAILSTLPSSKHLRSETAQPAEVWVFPSLKSSWSNGSADLQGHYRLTIVAIVELIVKSKSSSLVTEPHSSLEFPSIVYLARHRKRMGCRECCEHMIYSCRCPNGQEQKARWWKHIYTDSTGS